MTVIAPLGTLKSPDSPIADGDERGLDSHQLANPATSWPAESLGDRLKLYDWQRGSQRLTYALLRGACAGLATRGGVSLLATLTRVASRRKRATSDIPLFGATEATLRFGAFVGSFSGGFVFLDELIVLCLGHERTKAWRAALSGALAGSSMLLVSPDDRSMTLPLYLFVRAVALLVRSGNLPESPAWRRKLLAPTRWKHGDALLTCLSMSQITYSWFVKPETLSKSYVSFLNHYGGGKIFHYRSLGELASRKDKITPAPLAALQGIPGFENWVGTTVTDIAHPHSFSLTHALRIFPGVFKLAIPLYLPVYLVPAAIVQRTKLLVPVEEAIHKWRRLILLVFRSSAFLSSCTCLTWLGISTYQDVVGYPTVLGIALAGAFGGLAIFVEKKARRIELALYLACRALEGVLGDWMLRYWSRRQRILGSVPRLATRSRPMSVSTPQDALLARRCDVLLFSLAAAAFLHCYSDHAGTRRKAFRPSYLHAFDALFGGLGIEQGRVRHASSRLQLRKRLQARTAALRGRGESSSTGEENEL